MSREAIDALLARVESRFAATAGASLLSIALFALGLYGVWPLWQESGRLSEQVAAESRAELPGAGAVRRAEIARVEKAIESARGRLYGGAGGVPRREIESFVIDTLDELSTHHGVKLIGITPDEISEVVGFEEIPFRIDAEGPYFALHLWLLQLEERLRPMVVKKFELSPARGGAGVILDLRVVAYRAASQGDS
jgi:hypothetical protein